MTGSLLLLCILYLKNMTSILLVYIRSAKTSNFGWLFSIHYVKRNMMRICPMTRDFNLVTCVYGIPIKDI